MIKVNKTSLPGVLLIEREISFDVRGFFAEEWNKKEYKKNGINMHWKSSEFSRSKYNALRGLHGDTRTWKLISCTLGKIFLAVVNYDESSDFFGKFETFILTPENAHQVLIPPMHINGHYCMNRGWNQFKYMQSAYYQGAKNQFSVRWNDPRFNIPWPLKKKVPILSNRDKGL